MDPDQSPIPNPQSPSFEAALDRLERVVAELEGGDLGLDGALARYEEGVRLLSCCHGLLEGAERRIAVVTGVDASGSPETAPFDVATTAQALPAEPPVRARPRAAESGTGEDRDLPF